jgi:hypothetical protein
MTMAYEDIMKNQYDVVSLTRKGQEKRTNYVQDALQMNKQAKTSDNFVRVMADIFLKIEAGNGSYR